MRLLAVGPLAMPPSAAWAVMTATIASPVRLPTKRRKILSIDLAFMLFSIGLGIYHRYLPAASSECLKRFEAGRSSITGVAASAGDRHDAAKIMTVRPTGRIPGGAIDNGNGVSLDRKR